MDAKLTQSIRTLASYAATQHRAFRNSLLENCRQLAMEPETLKKELHLLGAKPDLLKAAENLEQHIAPNDGPISWVMARNLTSMLDPVIIRNPETARDIILVLKAETVNRMAFEAIDAKHASGGPSPAKPAV